MISWTCSLYKRNQRPRVYALFEEKVVGQFVRCYEEGGTPNPCVECNRFIKFSLLNDYAEKNGFDIICTGHYAKTGYENGRYFIVKSDDIKKDQSYVLYPLTQQQLSRVRFPLADITKEKARAKIDIAEDED